MSTLVVTRSHGSGAKKANAIKQHMEVEEQELRQLQAPSSLSAAQSAKTSAQEDEHFSAML